ncbi:MAG: winged helix-turn-helix transcriptional regulator [Actinomycetaceae bacterium]|nr:winged helix-turn-helix transcriptional regulator [Actinomycetaceae bacterium]
MADFQDVGTCDQILRLIIERGPITAGELAKILVLTPAAVRRHIAMLVADNYIETYEGITRGPARRGRPSRQYVATATGQEQLGQGYSDVARSALNFIHDHMGDDGVTKFIDERTKTLEERYRRFIDGPNRTTAEKTALLAEALTKDGFVATLRRGGPSALSVQLCQGHCPIREVAESFPELCEAETQAFGRLLGVPIQRLSTMSGGAHVCTTNIPLGIPKNLRARASSYSNTSVKADDREGNQ